MDNKEKQILHSWNENAAAWTESIRSGQIESRNLATNKSIVDAVKEHRPKCVLDVGCGEGWLVRELSGHGIEAIGIDGSDALIAKAKELGVGSFYTVTYQELSSSDVINCRDYEAIVCNFALIAESIDDLLITLRALVSKEGKLFVQTLHPYSACGELQYMDGWRTETFSAFGAGYKEAQPWFFRTLGSWIRVLNKAGWRIVDCREPIHPITGKPLSLLFICSK